MVSQKKSFNLKYNLKSLAIKLKKDFDFIIKKENINFLIKINHFRGLRHKLNLPVRGQRTHTNAKTNRLKYLKLKKK